MTDSFATRAVLLLVVDGWWLMAGRFGLVLDVRLACSFWCEFSWNIVVDVGALFGSVCLFPQAYHRSHQHLLYVNPRGQALPLAAPTAVRLQWQHNYAFAAVAVLSVLCISMEYGMVRSHPHISNSAVVVLYVVMTPPNQISPNRTSTPRLMGVWSRAGGGDCVFGCGG